MPTSVVRKRLVFIVLAHPWVCLWDIGIGADACATPGSPSVGSAPLICYLGCRPGQVDNSYRTFVPRVCSGCRRWATARKLAVAGARIAAALVLAAALWAVLGGEAAWTRFTRGVLAPV